MGQYLAIGLCASFSVSKAVIKRAGLSTVEEAETALQNGGYPLAIFERTEKAGDWVWELKEEVLVKEMAEFVIKQLKVYGKGEGKEEEELQKKLIDCKSKADFVKLAQRKYYVNFQWDKYGEVDYVDIAGTSNSLTVNYQCVMLFAQGKISMEVWGSIFTYFAQNIALANPEFALAKAMKVYITG
ncbi:MAG: hypothetical protein ACKVTZ_15385 [Bacteroidia bacterium]